jgi:hypothetical protein
MKTAIARRTARLVRRACLILLVSSVCLLAFTGCLGPGGPDGPKRPGGASLQPRLAAQAIFLDGTLVANLTLEPVIVGGGKAGNGKSGGSSRHPSPGGMGGGPPGGGMGGGPGGPPGAGSGPSDDEGPGMRLPQISAARIALHVTLTNTGKETLNFAVTDVISELGNFAIRPERMSLAPGQAGAIDPLGSVFPATLNELIVEVRVRRAGQTETQTVRLVPASPEAVNPDRP